MQDFTHAKAHHAIQGLEGIGRTEEKADAAFRPSTVGEAVW